MEKEWIERCIKFGAPEHGICRVSKTSREAMAGLYTAIENYVNQDEIERNQELRFLLHIISEKLKDGKMEDERENRGKRTCWSNISKIIPIFARRN
ncbi:MAG: hypothetical protein ACLS61_10340 [Ruminococcus sp.]